MLARLRNTTIALLGVVTVVGLSLIAFISQLGFPGVFSGAIPDGPGGSAAVGDAIALTQSGGVGHPGFVHHRASARIGSFSLGRSDPAAGPGLGGSNQVGHQPTAQPPSAQAQPPSAPAPEPAGEPTTASPAPSTGPPEPESSPPPKKTSSTKSKSKSKPRAAKGHSRGKAKDQAAAKPDTSPSGGSKSHHSRKPRHSSPPKSTGDSGESVTSASKPSGGPPSAKPGEGKPEAGHEEPGDAGKSDKSHH
jgi:hypothetical protein